MMRKAGNVEVGAGPVPGFPDGRRPSIGQVQAEGCQLRFGVSAEADGDDHVADDVFEDEVPADDPGEDFAERGVGIRVGAAGDGNHRGQFGIAESGEAAGQGDQKKRDGDGRSGRRTSVHQHCRMPPPRRKFTMMSRTCAWRIDGALKYSPAAAVPVSTKMPEPMMAPMPSAVSDQGPSVFCRRCPGLRTPRSACRSTCSRKAGCRWFERLTCEPLRRVPWVMVTRGSCLLRAGVGHGRTAHARSSDSGLSLRLAASQLLHLAFFRSAGVVAGFVASCPGGPSATFPAAPEPPALVRRNLEYHRRRGEPISPSPPILHIRDACCTARSIS